MSQSYQFYNSHQDLHPNQILQIQQIKQVQVPEQQQSEGVFHKMISLQGKNNYQDQVNQNYQDQYRTEKKVSKQSQIEFSPSFQNNVNTANKGVTYQQQSQQIQQSPQVNKPSSSVNQNYHQTKEKHNNSISSQGSRRYSFFSKTSFATSNSMTFGSKKLKGAHVPRVNITNIIKKRAYLYLDQDLAHTFDELLENGYEMVLNKKHERDTLKEIEENQRQECEEREKESVPLISQMYKLTDALEQEEILKGRYERENLQALLEIQQLREQIERRRNEIQQEEYTLNENIKMLELQNNDIRSQILMNKTNHRTERDQYERVIKQKRSELDNINSLLQEKKRLTDEKKMEQAERLRKMENKSKMYLGILKH